MFQMVNGIIAKSYYIYMDLLQSYYTVTLTKMTKTICNSTKTHPTQNNNKLLWAVNWMKANKNEMEQ